jgi:cytochrome c biogenesis protein CcmG/thiol:disulfide interchange protein DsbE
MKRAWLLPALAAGLIAVAVVVAYRWSHAPDATPVSAGDPAPELRLFTIGSAAPTRLSQFRGRPVLLAMFVEGCPACEEVVRRLERIQRELSRRGLVVLGVSADLDPAARGDFVRRLGITFFVLQDPGGVAIKEAFGTTRLPELYLIGPDGTVRGVYLGALGEREAELRDRAVALLDEAARRSTSPTR